MRSPTPGNAFGRYDATYVALGTRVGGIVMTIDDSAMRQRGVDAGLAVVTPSDVA